VVFYNRNLKVVPVEIGTRKMLAEAAEKSGDFALAIDSLKVLAELDPANGAAYGERIAALEGKTGR
jgi:predicted TPR repeat methyltransferase